MTHGTAIPWTHAPGYRGEVWNPVVGCTRVSAGCDHCFAFALHDRRYAANLAAARTAGYPSFGGMLRAGDPRRGEALAEARSMGLSIALPFPPQYDQPFSKVQLLPGRLDIPLHWRKPRMVFVCSMSDLFHEEVPDEFIERVLATAWVARLHTYLFLTKRAERMRAFFSESSKRIYNIGILGEEIAGRAMPSMIWPLPNVWLGVSVENQATVDERIPLLLDTPAAVRFVSAEPLLGPVDLEPYMIDLRDVTDDLLDAPDGAEVDGMERVGSQWCRNSGIDWLIVGGESGPHWRPMELAWVESLRAQCEAARVPMFGKQAAGPRPDIALPGRLGERSWPL